jgi:hypothetical protein
MKTIRNLFALGMLLIAGICQAQTNGIIKGTVVDEKKQPMPFVPVAVLEDSTIILSAQTDMNGEFTIKEVTPGKYNVKAIATGYNTFFLKGVLVESNVTRYLDLPMTVSSKDLPAVVISAEWVQPAFNPKFSTVTPISIDQIDNSATGKTDLVGLITMVTPGVLPTNDGKDIYLRGSRRGSTAYYVDGNRTMEVPDVPGMGIGGMEVLTGGVPAEYGDCTGGIVLITTKDYKVEMLRKENEREDRKAREKESKKD